MFREGLPTPGAGLVTTGYGGPEEKPGEDLEEGMLQWESIGLWRSLASEASALAWGAVSAITVRNSRISFRRYSHALIFSFGNSLVLSAGFAAGARSPLVIWHMIGLRRSMSVVV